MNNRDITISLDEYKDLIKLQAIVETFAAYVNKEIYISREDCAAFLGFELKELPEELND